MWQEERDKPKRNPYCSRCRNHGKRAQVKGHKRHCEYRHCQCDGCKLVECRQIVSAAQIKRRRYQKQDEECGRRIEVSPPVLTKTPSSDPAALIAKTLIQSSRQSGSGGVGSSSKSIDVGLPMSSLGQAQLQTQQRMMSLPPFYSPVPGTTLSDAIQLFQFTAAIRQQQANPSNLMISSGSSFGGGSNNGGGLGNGGPSSGPSSALLTNPQYSGMREQFNIVSEIHQTYGPLAIFAWLRSEDFNVVKIKTLIEMAKDSYDELLQMNGHSPMDLTSPIVDI